MRRRGAIRASGEAGSPPELDRAALSRVAHNVEILSVDLVGAHFERSDDDAFAGAVPADFRPEVGISVEWKIDDARSLLGCVLTFGTYSDIEPDPYTVIARFRLLYEVNPEVEPSNAELDQFAHWNAMFNAWPYWREYVASTINRAHLPQFTVPVMQVPMPKTDDV